MGTPRAIEVIRDASELEAAHTVSLTHDRRHRRRMAMSTDAGQPFILDLPDAIALRDGDLLRLTEGGFVRVIAEAEPVLAITADDAATLMRIAWHIGNRHLPAEVGDAQILIADDHVIADMVVGLGGHVERLDAAFQPEGGAYEGHGHA